MPMNGRLSACPAIHVPRRAVTPTALWGVSTCFTDTETNT
jgi:hypothetical protein